ncbi:E3 ubiquitin-protein ligase UBR1 [Phytophthora cinnamomi]|uniref:E3 ubiquitin-protein ligase UBR1 n=1 Tax=Phytophthora cinnamomi TaxID=4785 RepID=UPI003559C0AB|nr:E3 ubiquitin-protein ligase UBR1 [Phytophthora cinnamomi]
MVAIRGKKTKATAKPKAAASKAKVPASKEAEASAVTRLTPQQQLARRREQEFLALVRFALQNNLARGEAAQSASSVCNALLTSLCASAKEKALAPAQVLAKLPRTERKRVCGAIFSADEIAYSCRNCQLDTTCVMCKDCFTHSDHAGHDVYFQRTTAGSSCDCGDLHAWKRSGFCSRHKGAEGAESGAKKHKLPKHIGLMAPVVIDAVVEHIYQVMLGVDYGFELAEALELFTRDLPPKFLPIQSDTDVADASAAAGSSRAVPTRSTRLSAQFTSDPGARTNGPGGRLEAQPKEVQREPNSSENSPTAGVLFGIRLHNDDVHSLNEVINHLYVELGMSKPQARTVVHQVDSQDIQFRASMLEAYLRSYGSMTRMFLRGLGNSSESIFDFAVQFLTVPHLVQNYTKKEASAHPGRMELVRELLCALNMVFQSAINDKDKILNSDHPALSTQKYKHCVENLEYVFNIGTLSSELVCNDDNLKVWLSCLSVLQGGDPQVRRGIHQNHVEYESDSWLAMFNLGIRVHSVFAISWNGFKPSEFESPEARVAEIFRPIIEAALSSSARLNEKVEKKALVPVTRLASGSKRGIGIREKAVLTYDFNVASQPTSLHIPLHRFLTAAVRHICISPTGLGSSIPADGLLRVFGFDQLPADKQWELVEMPLRCLVMASQIHSNLWRRNGDENMLAQLYNYSALPYCIHYRDADMLMLQLGVLMIGPDALLARMVDRFQLGSYFVLTNGNDTTSNHDDLAKQFGYSPVEQGIDEQQRLQMLEEFLRLVIIVGTSIPSSTGVTYDDEFLAEEMLQQLCAKSLPFSKLFDLAILPSGQDDIPTARLEEVLKKVSDFVEPSGMEPASAAADRRFWTRLSKSNTATSKLPVLNLLSQLLDQATTLLDSEQTGTVEWLIWKITAESSACRKVFEQLANDAKAKVKKPDASPSAVGSAAQGSNSPPMTLEQRKMEARKRAMAAMAKRQAAFQAMVDLADEENEEMKSEEGHATSSALGKRKASMVDEPDISTEKHQKTDNEPCYNCILCHDSSSQGQMGMAAYVHQSTVLAPGFRPEPHEALGAEGKKVRSHVKKVIEKMELCSGGSSTPSDVTNSPSPTLRAFATSFPEWYMDGSLEDQLTRDNTAQNSPRPPAARRPRDDRIRFGNAPALEGELLQTDDELEVLESVMDLREDQQLFPMDMRGAVSLDLRGDRVEPRRLRGREVGARGGAARRQGAPMYDSDDDDDFSSRFRLERMPPGFGRPHESAKLYLTPCGLHVRTCQHAVHIHCLERYITSLHDKAMRGEEFDGVQAIDPDSAMTQFLCPLCKTLCNFLIPTSEPRISIVNEDKQEHKRSVAAPAGIEEKTPTWDAIVEEQLSMPGWYRSVLGRDGGFEDDENDTEHDLWRDYFEETLWEPHGSLEKGAPFLWSACAFTLASFLTVAEDEHRNASGSTAPFDPLTDPCPSSLEKEMESLTAVTKFCRWTFSLLEHSADAKVIWETAKRCCPINTETKREYRKFTKVLGSIDACLRGTILGLLVADTFTAFVVACVIADELETIWRFIPVFTAADLLQRLHTEFFEPSKSQGTSLFQDKFSTVEWPSN